MKARASARFVRVAPRKARVVVDMIRGKYADEALEALRFAERRAAGKVSKVLASAVANAVTGFQAEAKKLVVSEAFVDKGPVLKRFIPRARGMASKVNKFTSHITIVVSERE